MSWSKIIQSPWFFLGLAIILFFPVFLINLEDQPIIEDESIRSLVAFEMYKSGDYITPTIGCDPYLRKPPLYNWLIAASYGVFGNYSETAIRFPMVISLFFFGFLIFYYVRKAHGLKMGVINALIFITLGRILFYESLHGLIDIAFSALTYLVFMASYFLFQRKKFLSLFLVAYGVTAITWLMKGAPALVFLGITLLVLFIAFKRFRMLFNWRHFAGIFLFILLVGSYYVAYFIANDITPEKLFGTLIEQTTRRTVIRFGWLLTIKHFFLFPFEMFYHFMPWTIFSILLFKKGAYRTIMDNPFLKYNFLLLVFQIIPYWTSPEVHPRYILMLAPLFFTLVTFFYFHQSQTRSKLVLAAEYIIIGLLVLSWIGPYGALFHHMTSNIDHILLIAISLSLIMITVTIFYWREKNMRIFWFALALLVIRLGFDFIILPTRQKETVEIPAKQSAYELAKMTEGKELYAYFNPEASPDWYYNRNVMHFRFHFYLASARNELLCNTSQKMPGVLYVSTGNRLVGENYVEIAEINPHLDGSMPLKLFYFKFEDGPPHDSQER